MSYWKLKKSRVAGKVPTLNEIDLDTIVLNQADAIAYVVKLLAGGGKQVVPLAGGGGREIELQVAGDYIQWRYVGDPAWVNLVALSAITGPPGTPGSHARAIELRAASGYIQWRYDGDPAWMNLIALSAITGAPGEDGVDGKAVELQVSGGYIKWRYVGDVAWVNLIAVADITGAPGAPGSNGRNIELQTASGYVQWRYVGDSTWLNLIALSAITGPAGTPGADGRYIELQVSDGYLQWRFFGESDWINIIALSELFVAATAAEINAGTENGKVITPKGVQDSNIFLRARKNQIKDTTEKTTIADDDSFLIDDSEALYVKKSLKWSTIFTKLKNSFDNIYGWWTSDDEGFSIKTTKKVAINGNPYENTGLTVRGAADYNVAGHFIASKIVAIRAETISEFTNDHHPVAQIISSSSNTTTAGFGGTLNFRIQSGDEGSYHSLCNVIVVVNNIATGESSISMSNSVEYLTVDQNRVHTNTNFSIKYDKAYYIGDTETNGSWRIVINGSDLVMQKRISGIWVTKQTITG